MTKLNKPELIRGLKAATLGSVLGALMALAARRALKAPARRHADAS